MAGNLQAIKAGQAYFQLFADNSELIAGLRRAENAVTRFMDNVQLIGTRLGNFGRSLTIPIADLISEYAKFDDQMRITAAVTNSTERVYRKLSQSALDATKKMTFKPVEAAGAMAQLGKAGFSSREIEDSAESVMRLARATGVSLPEATRIASTVMRTFNMNSKQMGNVVDVMTASANTAMQSVTDLADALSYAGPIAAQVGMDIKETSKAVSVLANYGIRGSRAGTALRQMLSRMGNTRVQGLYRELGVEISDTSGKLRGLGEILVDVGKAMSNMPEATRLSYLTKMFGMYGMAGGAVLSAHGFDSVADAIENCDGVAQRTAERMDAGIGGFLRRLSTTLNRLGVTIGKVAAPAFMRWNAAVGLTGEILERIINRSGRLIRGILNFGMILTGMSAGFIGGAIALKGFAGILALVRTGITPVVRAVGLVGRSFAGLVGFAGKGIGAIKSVYASLRAFSLSKLTLKGLNFGNVGAGMMGFGAALHVLNGNAKQVRDWLKEIGDKYPKLARLSSVLMSLMDKFGIGSNAIRKFATALAMVGGGLLIVPRILMFGEGIGRMTKRILEFAGATQHNLFGSLTRIGVTSLVAGTGFRFLEGNIVRVRESLVSFAKQVPIASGVCGTLVRVLDRLSASSATFNKKADFFNKLGGFALAVQPLRAAAGAVRSIGSSMSGAIHAVTRPMAGFVRTVSHLSRSLNRLLDRSLLGFLAVFGAAFVGLAATWRVARGGIDSLAESIQKLKGTFPELSGVIDMASNAVLRFGRITDAVLAPIIALGKGIAQVGAQVLGVVTAFATTVGYMRLTARLFSQLLPIVSNVAAVITEAVLTAISSFFPPLIAFVPIAGQIIRMLTAAAGTFLYLNSIVQVFGKTFEVVSGKVYNVLNGQWLAGVVNKVISTVSHVAAYLGNAFNNIVSVVQNAIGQLGSFGGGLFGELFGAVDGLIGKIGDLVRAIFGIANSGKGFLVDLSASFQNLLQNVLAGVQNTVQNIVAFVRNAVTETQGIIRLAFAGFRAGQVEKTIAYLFAEVQLKAAQVYAFFRRLIMNIADTASTMFGNFVSRIPLIIQAINGIADQVAKIVTSLTQQFFTMMENIRHKTVSIVLDIKSMIGATIDAVIRAGFIAFHTGLAKVYESLANIGVAGRAFLGIDKDEMIAKQHYHADEAIKARMLRPDTNPLNPRKSAERRFFDGAAKAGEELKHAKNLENIQKIAIKPFELDSQKIQAKLQGIIDKLDKEIEILKTGWTAQDQQMLAAKTAARDQAQAELQSRIEAHENNQDYKNTLADRRAAAENKRDQASQQREVLTQQKAQTREKLNQDKQTLRDASNKRSAARARRDIAEQEFDLAKQQMINAGYGDDPTFWPKSSVGSYAWQTAQANLTQANNDYQQANAEYQQAQSAVRADQQDLRGLNEQGYIQQSRQQSAKAELKQIAKEERIMDKVYRDNPAIQESQKNISDLDQQLEDYIEGGGSSRSAYANKLRGRRRREQRRLNKMEKRRSRLEDKYGLSQDQQAQADFAAQAQMQMASNPIVNVQTQASSVGTFDPNALGGFDNAYWYREQTQKQTDVLTEIRDYAQSIDTALNEEASVAWL